MMHVTHTQPPKHEKWQRKYERVFVFRDSQPRFVQPLLLYIDNCFLCLHRNGSCNLLMKMDVCHRFSWAECDAMQREMHDLDLQNGNAKNMHFSVRTHFFIQRIRWMCWGENKCRFDWMHNQQHLNSRGTRHDSHIKCAAIEIDWIDWLTKRAERTELLANRIQMVQLTCDADSNIGNCRISRCRCIETSPRSSSGNSFKIWKKVNAQRVRELVRMRNRWMDYLINIDAMIQRPHCLEIVLHSLF